MMNPSVTPSNGDSPLVYGVYQSIWNFIVEWTKLMTSIDIWRNNLTQYWRNVLRAERVSNQFTHWQLSI